MTYCKLVVCCKHVEPQPPGAWLPTVVSLIGSTARWLVSVEWSDDHRRGKSSTHISELRLRGVSPCRTLYTKTASFAVH